LKGVSKTFKSFQFYEIENQKEFKAKKLNKYERKMRRKTIFAVQFILIYLAILSLLLSFANFTNKTVGLTLLITSLVLMLIGLMLKSILGWFS
jgi:membrane-bound ClpP family serine protease